jgi:hypothetical protein
MKHYRTRRELACLSLAETLAELDRLKIEPEGQTVYCEDGPVVNGCITSGEPPAYLHESQKREIQEKGSTMLTLQQQVEQGTTLALWRLQIYQHGVAAYVQSLGMAKCLRELKARNAELSVWEGRNVSRQEVEKKLIYAIANEQEEEA